MQLCPRPIIFLDIDGVLNDHRFDEDSQSTTIQPRLATRLTALLEATNARIIVSSAWRYMMLKGAMNALGFEYLLRTHGIPAQDRIIGITQADEYLGWSQKRIRAEGVALRTRQILEAAERHPGTPWVAIDDLPLGLPAGNFHLADGLFGLLDRDVDDVIGKLDAQHPNGDGIRYDLAPAEWEALDSAFAGDGKFAPDRRHKVAKRLRDLGLAKWTAPDPAGYSRYRATPEGISQVRAHRAKSRAPKAEA